jgi:spore germination protein
LKLSTFNGRTNLPPAIKHSVKSGDAVFAIAKRYGVDLSMILAVKDITNPDVIIVGQVIQIRAQHCKVATGDYLDAIVKTYSVSLSALKELNGQIQNPDLIFPGQMVKVPSI